MSRLRLGILAATSILAATAAVSARQLGAAADVADKFLALRSTGSHVGAWTVTSRKDEFSDAKTILANMRGTGGAEFSFGCGSGHPILQLSLQGRQFAEDDVFRFLLRIDDGEITKGGLVVVAKNGLVFSAISRTTYRKLLAAKKIALRVKFTEGGLEDFLFTPGRTPALGKVLRTSCPVEAAPADQEPLKYEAGDVIETPAEMKAQYRSLMEKKKADEAKQPAAEPKEPARAPVPADKN